VNTSPHKSGGTDYCRPFPPRATPGRQPSRKFSAPSNKEKPRQFWGAAFWFERRRLNLTEPLRSFCPSFSLAEGLVVIASHRQLVPIIGATPFGDTGVDNDSASLVCEDRHWSFPNSLKVHIANLGTAPSPGCVADHNLHDNRQ
jgi:hypothetical protein